LYGENLTYITHIHMHMYSVPLHCMQVIVEWKLLSRPPEDNDANCTQFSECFNSNTAMLYMECISRIFFKTYWYSRVKIFCISFLITLWQSRSSIYRKPKQDIRSLGRFYNTHLYEDFVKKSIWSSGVLLWLFCFQLFSLFAERAENQYDRAKINMICFGCFCFYLFCLFSEQSYWKRCPLV